MIVRPRDKVNIRTTEEIPIAKEIAVEMGGGGHDTEAGAQPSLCGPKNEVGWYEHWASMGDRVREKFVESTIEKIDEYSN